MINKNISILHVTRKNVSEANRALESLYFSAKDPSSLEILIAIDNDDEESIDFFSGSINYDPKVFIFEKSGGYECLTNLFNELAKQSTGNWLIPWADDCRIQTEHWDEILNKRVGSDFLHAFYDTSIYGRKWTIERDQIFNMAISRCLVEAIGTLSPYYQIDAFYERLCYPLGIVSRTPRIYVYHYGLDPPLLTAKQELYETTNAKVSKGENGRFLDIEFYRQRVRHKIRFFTRLRVFLINVFPNSLRFSRLIKYFILRVLGLYKIP